MSKPLGRAGWMSGAGPVCRLGQTHRLAPYSSTYPVVARVGTMYGLVLLWPLHNHTAHPWEPPALLRCTMWPQEPLALFLPPLLGCATHPWEPPPLGCTAWPWEPPPLLQGCAACSSQSTTLGHELKQVQHSMYGAIWYTLYAACGSL